MITKIEDFNKAREVAEGISLGEITDIKTVLENSGNHIADPQRKKEFYDYIGSLLLNTILNREQEVLEAGVERALEGRRVIKDIINSL